MAASLGALVLAGETSAAPLLFSLSSGTEELRVGVNPLTGSLDATAAPGCPSEPEDGC